MVTKGYRRSSGAMELIEIGALRLNKHFQVAGQFQCFVKSVGNRLLTPFCTQLTGIRQGGAENAEILPKAAQTLAQKRGRLRVSPRVRCAFRT